MASEARITELGDELATHIEARGLTDPHMAEITISLALNAMNVVDADGYTLPDIIADVERLTPDERTLALVSFALAAVAQ